MDTISKILILIILACVGGILYVSYNFIRFMELIGILNPVKMIKEMMLFFVYITLFGLVISTTVRLLMKVRKYAGEKNRVP
jgi:hypothetical protein